MHISSLMQAHFVKEIYVIDPIICCHFLFAFVCFCLLFRLCLGDSYNELISSLIEVGLDINLTRALKHILISCIPSILILSKT